MSSFVSFAKTQTSASILAVGAPIPVEADVAEFLENMRRATKLTIDAKTKKRSPTTLAGFPAEQITAKGRSQGGRGRRASRIVAHAWVMRRANTSYFAFLVGSDSMTAAEANEVAGFLSLLEWPPGR